MKKVLLEGISDVLYHVTDLWAGLEILATDRFRLTPTIDTHDLTGWHGLRGVGNLSGDVSREFRLSGKRFYFGSFARSTGSKYHKFLIPQNSAVLFVLDGRRLGQRYSGKAVNYFWQGTGGGFSSGWKQKWDEMEDRLVSDKPYIEGFTKYIREIRVLIRVGSDGKMGDKDGSRLRKLLILGKKKGLPVRVWPDWDKASYLNGRKRDELSPEALRVLLSGRKAFHLGGMPMGVNKEDALLMGALVEFFEGRSDGRKIKRIVQVREDIDDPVEAIGWMEEKIVNPEWSRWRARILKLVRDRWEGNFKRFLDAMEAELERV